MTILNSLGMLDSTKLEEIVGDLQTYELDMFTSKQVPKKEKGIALKAWKEETKVLDFIPIPILRMSPCWQISSKNFLSFKRNRKMNKKFEKFKNNKVESTSKDKSEKFNRVE